MPYRDLQVEWAMLLLGGAAMLPPTVRLDFIVMFIVLLYLARPLRQRFALPPLPKGEALAVHRKVCGSPEALPLGELAKPSGFD